LSFDLLDEHELETFPGETLARLKQHVADDRAANRG